MKRENDFGPAIKDFSFGPVTLRVLVHDHSIGGFSLPNFIRVGCWCSVRHCDSIFSHGIVIR